MPKIGKVEFTSTVKPIYDIGNRTKNLIRRIELNFYKP